MLCEFNLYVPSNVKVCIEHLQNNNWSDLINHCNMVQQFNAEQFTDVCNILKRAITSRLSFDVINGLTDRELHFWDGLNNDQFNQIFR